MGSSISGVVAILGCNCSSDVSYNTVLQRGYHKNIESSNIIDNITGRTKKIDNAINSFLRDGIDSSLTEHANLIKSHSVSYRRDRVYRIGDAYNYTIEITFDNDTMIVRHQNGFNIYREVNGRYRITQRVKCSLDTVNRIRSGASCKSAA